MPGDWEEKDTEGLERTTFESNAQVAYFSMEIGLHHSMPTYSGGLGVLAGDTLKAAADLGFPLVGVTLAHRKGYFRQQLDAQGQQRESEEGWDPAGRLEEMKERATVRIDGRDVQLRAWRCMQPGNNGTSVAVYFLDTRLPENAPQDQALTDHLYGGDPAYRLSQEIVLGIGGVRMLRALGYPDLRVFHMNEGHSALLTMALLEERVHTEGVTEHHLAEVRKQCVFTTHTPVPAGHDQFDRGMVYRYAGERMASLLEGAGAYTGDMLNMTHLALRLSHWANAVAMRHGQVSREMFPGHEIQAITNGVHSSTWVAEPMGELYDRYMPGWRQVSFAFRHAIGIPAEEILRAHNQAKADMLAKVEGLTGVKLDPRAMTIGFARRAAKYKRLDLLFRNVDRLKQIATEVGPFQVVVSGKAHPHDEGAKELIRRVHDAARETGDAVKVVYIEDYNMEVASWLIPGVDVWLNNPQRPLEASGTSGMKAAMNGVPSLSTLDGWWIEGHEEGVTGWSIGNTWDPEPDERDAESLYGKLEMVVLPLYYNRPDRFAHVMRSAIALNGSFFNAQRMVLQYAREAYHL